MLVPTCAPGFSWSALARALDVEFRTMGSSLADDEQSDLLVVLELPCGGSPTHASVRLVHVESGRSLTDRVDLDEARRRVDRVRVVALALSEIVRSRYPEVATAPPPPEPPPAPEALVDLGRFDAQISHAARVAVRFAMQAEPEPEPEPELAPAGTLMDLSFGISSYPATSYASADTRIGFSFRTPSFRLGVDVLASGGWASSPLGDVALGGLGLGFGARLVHDAPDWLIAVGIRIDGGWTRATGVPNAPFVEATYLDAMHVAVVFDARLRLRVGPNLFFLMTPEVGAALVGIDVRADGHRITAQLGPRLGLSIGLSFSP